MPATGYFTDASLLLLLVVGNEDKALITQHKWLKTYSTEDYDILQNLLGQTNQVLVTPNTLTETSNLLGQHAEPNRSRFFRRLRFIIQNSKEVIVSSAMASANRNFERLGLTDAALLEVITAETPLVTSDIGLHLAAVEKGDDMSVNFTYRRNL